MAVNLTGKGDKMNFGSSLLSQHLVYQLTVLASMDIDHLVLTGVVNINLTLIFLIKVENTN